MATQKMQAVKLTLSDGREGVFIGMVAFDGKQVADDKISEITISGPMEYDVRVSFDDLWLMAGLGGSVQ